MNGTLTRTAWLGCEFLIALLLAIAMTNCARAQQSATAPAGEFRKWTDKTGKYSVMAELVELDGERIVLKKKDGSIARVPLDRLSEPDRRAALATKRQIAVGKQESRTGPPIDLTTTAQVSREAPFGMMVFGDLRRQEPVFVTLIMQGKAVADISEYGYVEIDGVVDDKKQRLKLLKPIETEKFQRNLEKQFVELDHFFLDRSDTLPINLLLQKPSEGATALSLAGSLQIKMRQAILVDNVLEQIGKPLTTPGLEKLGRFRVSAAGPDDYDDPERALVIEFVGDPDQIHEIGLTRGDGSKLKSGHTTTGSGRRARAVLSTIEKIPKDTKLRIVPAGKAKFHTIPFRLINVPIRDDADDDFDSPDSDYDVEPASRPLRERARDE